MKSRQVPGGSIEYDEGILESQVDRFVAINQQSFQIFQMHGLTTRYAITKSTSKVIVKVGMPDAASLFWTDGTFSGSSAKYKRCLDFATGMSRIAFDGEEVEAHFLDPTFSRRYAVVSSLPYLDIGNGPEEYFTYSSTVNEEEAVLIANILQSQGVSGAQPHFEKIGEALVLHFGVESKVLKRASARKYIDFIAGVVAKYLLHPLQCSSTMVTVYDEHWEYKYRFGPLPIDVGSLNLFQRILLKPSRSLLLTVMLCASYILPVVIFWDKIRHLHFSLIALIYIAIGVAAYLTGGYLRDVTQRLLMLTGKRFDVKPTF